MTSSAGRLFDAVAVLAGLRHRVSYEGQAAMELEWLATGVVDCGAYPFEWSEQPGVEPAGTTVVVDTRPLIRAVAHDAGRGVSAALISRRFHTTMVELIASVCDHVRRSMQLDAVVLSGGVFMNALLSSEANTRLIGDGFRVYRHRLVPPNDGGLSLGQVAVAAALAQCEPARAGRCEAPRRAAIIRAPRGADRRGSVPGGRSISQGSRPSFRRRRRCVLESPEK